MLVCEIEHAEGVTFFEIGRAPRTQNKAVGHRGKSAVFDGIETEHLSGGDVIVYLGLTGIVGRVELRLHFGMEVAEVVERVGGYLNTCRGIDIRDKHRLCGKGLVHPAGKLALTIHIAVISPQAEGDGKTVVGTAKERIVWRRLEHGIHFNLGGFEFPARSLSHRTERVTLCLCQFFLVREFCVPGRGRQFHRMEYGIYALGCVGYGRDDTGRVFTMTMMLFLFLLMWQFTLLQILDAVHTGIECFALRQITGDGAGAQPRQNQQDEA